MTHSTGRCTPALMIQGTGSNVGKSLIVAGLCRLFANRGMTVRPFKPQNMSNNAAVTSDGGEIGRAQALQAMGCRVPLTVHMNPVLLKPETDTGAQIIVQGKRFGTMRAREYGKQKAELLPKVLESFSKLQSDADLVIVEGAGSPAEINLRAGDIANMGFAEAADLPVVLCADIDRGGVIASVVGTHAVLEPSEQDRIKAFFINRFRGDPSLFDDGMREIAQRTGWQGLGVVPWFADANKLPAEDALDLASGAGRGRIKIVVPVISRIANFDDLDPLRMEPDVSLELISLERPCREMRISSFCPDPNQPSAIWRSSGNKAGTLTWQLMCAGAAMFSGFAAVIRCSAKPSPTLMASRDRPELSKGWAS
jgi:adenosylcobyric acid synthase